MAKEKAVPHAPAQAHRMHTTRNALPSNAKSVSVDLLNARLADGIDLALLTKQAHWNLKGPQFIGVHLMLDGFRTDQDEWNDSMAERAVQLGGTALGTTQATAAATTLPAYPTNIYKVADHLAALIDRYAHFANSLHENIDQADEAGDADTADIFTEVSRGIDKQLWFLEAHVQEPTGEIRDGDGK